MQMQKLLAADELYAAVVRPEINGVLAANGIEGSDVPKSFFVPDETRWLDESDVTAALGSVSGSTGAASPGVHGLGLIGTSVNGTELSPNRRPRSWAKARPEVEVEVQTRANRPRTGSPSRSPSAAATP